jgi:hypothetical protein
MQSTNVTRRSMFGFLAALPLGGVLLSTMFNQSARADQPKMEAALRDLQSALNNLRAATDDKGGHRRKAIVNVEQAIRQTELGIKFDRRN